MSKEKDVKITQIRHFDKNRSELFISVSDYLKHDFGKNVSILDYNVEVQLEEKPNDPLSCSQYFPKSFVVPGLAGKESFRNPFFTYLLFLINRDGRTGKDLYGPHEVYFSRKVFSKMMQNGCVSKENILKLSVLLRLKIEEATKLLGLAGFGMNKGMRRDAIIIYAIENGFYDPDELDTTLINYGELELFNKEPKKD